MHFLKSKILKFPEQAGFDPRKNERGTDSDSIHQHNH